MDPTDRIEQVERLESQLNRYRSMEDQFAALKNDLNNLLAAMKGQAQLACDDPLGQEKDELVRVVLSATAKAQSILQRFDTPPPPAPPDAPRRPPAQHAGAPQAASILVVDDEESMRNLLARILQPSGYDVVLASSGHEAIEWFANKDFDLAFLDIQLGDMKGTEVFEEMHKVSPSTHVIFASGDPSLESMTDAAADRVPTIFISKPFDVSEIKQRVNAILTMRSALQ